MQTVLLVLGAILILIGYAIWSFLHKHYMHKIKKMNRYELKRIPPFGQIPHWYEWYKSDEEALSQNKDKDFISRVYPNHKFLKPGS